MNSKTDVKKMISPEAKVALDCLMKIVDAANDTDKVNALIVIQSNLDRMKQDNSVGLIKNEDFETKLNQINANILRIIDGLPEHYFNPDSKTNSSSNDTPTGSSGSNSSNRLTASKLIQELSDFEIKYALEPENYSNPLSNYTIDNIYRSKREALVYQTIWFLESNQVTVSSAEYVVIAMSLVNVFDDQGAEKYYKKAMNNIDTFTESAISKISAIRSYADFLYLKGRFEEGAKQFDGAIIQGDDDTTLAINGYTMQLKCYSESSYQNMTNAEKAYSDALAFFNKIKNKPFQLNNLDSLNRQWQGDAVPTKTVTVKKTGAK